MIPSQIEKDYEVLGLVGTGAFSRVYSGPLYPAIHKCSNTRVAIKLTDLDSASSPDAESQVLNLKGRPAGVPRLIDQLVYGKCRVTVLELLGESFFDMMQRRRGPLSLELVVKGLYDGLKVLKWMHKKGFVHRDVKPDNLLLGCGSNLHQTYLIDYSDSRPFRNQKCLDTLVGNPYFTSLKILQGGEEGPGDDLEGLLCSLVYLLQGNLPWMGIIEADPDRLREQVRTKKEALSPSQLFKKCPSEFEAIFLHIRSLSPLALPDYSLLFSLTKALATRISLDLKPALRMHSHHMKKRGSFCATGSETINQAVRSSSMRHYVGKNQLCPGEIQQVQGTEESKESEELNTEDIPTLVSTRLPAFTTRVLTELLRRRMLRRKIGL